jgi:hypothetical protein
MILDAFKFARPGRAVRLLLTLLLALNAAMPARAAEGGAGNEGAQVLQAFEKPQTAPVVDETLRTRHKVMFLLGIPLLLLLLITGALGVATGLFGKPLFVLHMLFAGLSVTLAIVHAIVGLVWFYPF